MTQQFDTHQFMTTLDALFAEHASPERIDDFLQEAMVTAENAGDNAGLLAVLNETMGFYRSQERHDENQWIVQRSLELAIRMGLTGTPTWVTTLINAATAMRAAQHYDQAEDLYDQALAAAQNICDPNDRTLAALHNNRSMLFMETDRPEQARDELEQALRIMQQQSPDTQRDLDIASSLTNLAQVWQAIAHKQAATSSPHVSEMEVLQSLHQALTTAQQALDAFHACNQDNDGHAAAALITYGNVLVELGRIDEALPSLRRAIDVLALNYGPDSIRTKDFAEYVHSIEEMANQVHAEVSSSSPHISESQQPMAPRQTGMELSREFWNTAVRPMLEQEFPELLPRIAAGLVGHGSECFGFDDEISQDHDFFPRVCIWLTPEDFVQYGQTLQNAYETTQLAYVREHGNEQQLGQLAYVQEEQSKGRTARDGVFSIPQFFEGLTGQAQAPRSDEPHLWLMLDETTLATATNGRIFADPLGAFSKARQAFLLMPDDVRIALISRRLGMASQGGQANLPRMFARNDASAAMLCITEFVHAITSLVFLMNEPIRAGYCPYYKWQFAALRKLSARPAMMLDDVCDPLEHILQLSSEACFNPDSPARKELTETIELICNRVTCGLQAAGLTSSAHTFLEWQRPYVEEHISSSDPSLHK
ncbi:tetratricopeptide repeat protein [Bifidobacterium dolichotidis]|uniref:Tetratricopeptide repeat protein n=1 Tax=Bifidobacterium dolichotidis TaxID=2306976 RepID=A0A430FQ32_9BIFI|nr:DUF4037 domain-containing protein [Bifidobacterium dolichotidis]RSX54928.1 tetratricopeptide repeat protein [Bifidobacterium dolichotidis]